MSAYCARRLPEWLLANIDFSMMNDTAMTVGERFRASTLEHIHRPAFEDENLSLDYGELWRRSSSVSAALARHGVEPGQRIAIMAGDGGAYLAVLLGLWLRGCVPIPVNRTQTQDKTRFILEQSTPRG